jgi:hypothetical protein
MNLCLIHRGRLWVRIVQIHLTEDTEDGWLSMLHYKQKTTVVYNKLIYIIELLFVFINIGKSARCSEFNVNISMG